MRRNTSINNSRGFSLIELCIALGILVILTSSITPVFIKRIQVKAGEKTALEMSVIQQAALAYYVANNAWPANIPDLENGGYLNPAWVANNPWQNVYTISSTSSAFTVSTVVPREWTNLVGRDLPTSSISGTTVGSAVPVPGSAPDESLPAGSIIMWSGTLSSVPANWQLCDGTNGTPDLRDRFIVGAGKSYSVGVNGGEAMHTLTTAEMPPHAHNMNGFHIGSRWGAEHPTFIPGGAGIYTDSAGGGQPHENRPPYYALCFIMKVS